MRYIYYTISFVVLTFLFTGCVTTSKISKGEFYPKLYAKSPKSILVLPARNTTTSVEATDHFRYTITKPLTEKGYYVFPVHLVDSFFKSENLSDAELIRKIPVAKLKEIFNPDAILYVDINAWDTGYTVITSNVDVGLSFSLVDANSGEEIWQNNAYAYSYDGIDTGNGIIGLIVSAISTAINTGTDYTKLSHVANEAGSSALPYGAYHEKHKIDAEDTLQFFDMAKLEDNRLYVDKYFIVGNEKEGKIPLTIRRHAKGYHSFSIYNLNFFNHNGYKNYYITQKIEGKQFIRNRFFRYENHQPYLLVNNQKVFVESEADGTIPYSEDSGKYYFSINNIVAVKQVEK